MSSPDLLSSGGEYVFDLETNGLLAEVSVIHCAVLIDIHTDEVLSYGPVPFARLIPEFLSIYGKAKKLIGHNIIGYDVAVIEKLHKLSPHRDCELVDTLCYAKLAFADIKATDFPLASKWKKWKAARDAHQVERDALLREDPENPIDIGEYTAKPPQEFPGQFVGAHSLEAWGYRMGTERKGDYSKDMKAKGLDPWASWNQEMHDYMIQDAVVNLRLYRHLEAQKVSPQALKLTMRTQRLCSKIERNGWPFNVKAAQELYATLSAERETLSQSLRSLFPAWTVDLEDFIPKRDNKTKGYLKGVPVPRTETIEFNPSSRQHIESRLKAKYNWDPQEYTPSGQAKIDDDVLKALPYPEAQALARYFTIQKRIGQLAEGDKAWLKYVTKEGKIHGRYTVNGTVTGRASHSNPNIGQVPAVGADFGRECRALFTVPPGWVQLGADQSGLELRCLGSYLSSFDLGAYIQIVLHGDVHWENVKAIWALDAALKRDDSNPQHKTWRGWAKTIIYALLYGAADPKLGQTIGKGRKAGATIRARLEGKFPALAKLVKRCKEATKAKGWLKGLDGRQIPVRGEHSALNSLLQSAGAVICMQWICDAEQALLDAGLKHGWDGDFVFLGWIHDEIQLAVRKGVDIELVQRLIVEAGRAAGEPFPQWNCPLDVETKIGADWAECH